MTKSTKQAPAKDQEVAASVRRAAKAERRLLAEERAIERRLLKARTRLGKAERRLEAARDEFDQRAERVATFERDLATAQAARAAGPAESDGTAAGTEQPAVVEATGNGRRPKVRAMDPPVAVEPAPPAAPAPEPADAADAKNASTTLDADATAAAFPEVRRVIRRRTATDDAERNEGVAAAGGQPEQA